MNSVKKVAESIEEAVLHLERIEFATSNIISILPLTLNSYKALDFNTITYLDQILFRYIKLQDLMGKKMFPSVLEALDEDIIDFVMKDILNKLESIGILNALEWLTARGYRNGIAHEYPGEEQVVVDSINDIINSIPMFLTIITNIMEILRKHGIEFNNKKTSIPPFDNINKLKGY